MCCVFISCECFSVGEQTSLHFMSWLIYVSEFCMCRLGYVHCRFLYMLIVILFNHIGCHVQYVSRVMRKPDFCICENKDADQLRGDLISAFVFAT